MTNVSRRKTDSRTYTTAESELASLIGSLSTKRAREFISGLLTEAEQVLLTKRFAAICMAARGESSYRIAETLDLSISTAQRVVHDYRSGHYAGVLSAVPECRRNTFIDLLFDLTLARGSMAARKRVYRRGGL